MKLGKKTAIESMNRFVTLERSARVPEAAYAGKVVPVPLGACAATPQVALPGYSPRKAKTSRILLKKYPDWENYKFVNAGMLAYGQGKKYCDCTLCGTENGVRLTVARLILYDGVLVKRHLELIIECSACGHRDQMYLGGEWDD